MSALLFRTVLILGLVGGMGGGAVALAADYQPDTSLYPADLTMEQMKLNTASDLFDQIESQRTLVLGGNPEPGDGDCEPDGDQHQYGPGGNPNPCDGDCEPDGDEHQYRPGGNPDLGGSQDCPNGDCEPEGDQHQHGPKPDQPWPGGPGGDPDGSGENRESTGDQHQHGGKAKGSGRSGD